MAKKNKVLFKLVSTAKTGFYYLLERNPKTQPEKVNLMKYDPRVRKHVLFEEKKHSS